MFTVEQRDGVRETVLGLAGADERIVAGAEIGALTEGGDRWSDLDLTFAVSAGVAVTDVLADWTARVAQDLGAVHLFDLPSGPTTYRVFLLPGCLQVDLSFTPEADFGPRGPRFRLLFGQAADTPSVPEPPAEELLGYGVHHAVRARVCLERGRLWQAEYWVSATRDQALALACRRHGLESRYGRGAHRLPVEVLAPLAAALVRSLEPAELERALTVAVAGLLREGAAEARELTASVEPLLRELVA